MKHIWWNLINRCIGEQYMTGTQLDLFVQWYMRRFPGISIEGAISNLCTYMVHH